MLPLAEAQSRLFSTLAPLPAVSLELAEAVGRVLREPVTAPLDLPQFDASSMDGYAVRAEDVRDASYARPVMLRQLGAVPAGRAATATVIPGGCVRVFTGSVLPPGADAVIRQEVTRSAAEGEILIRESAAPGEFVRRRGTDVVSGSTVARAGQWLTPGRSALLAALGVSRVAIGPRPSVAILATGDELRSPGQPLAPGQIYESNRVVIAALCTQAGAVPQTAALVPDDPVATREALTRAFSECDVVVTVGGVSVGERDFVKAALTEAGGRLDFWRVAMKPGKPFVFGRLGSKPLFGLPGNPVSAFVTFLLLVRPALWRLQGLADCTLPTRGGWLAEPVANEDARPHFLRVTVQAGHLVTSAGLQASHALGSLASADGLLEVPPQTAWDAGRPVSVLTWE